MPDFRITVDLINVGPGDADDIYQNVTNQVLGDLGIEEADDEVVIRLSQKVGDNFFGRDPGDDLIMQ
jgi:hypothetical protein